MVMNGRSTRPNLLASEAGFGLIEVMVSAVVVVLIATATVSSIGSAQKQSARTLARGIAGNLAERDQERMRSMRAADLAASYVATDVVEQENVNYTVDSRADFVQGPDSDAVSCSSTGEQARHLQLTTKVTPQESTREKPLTIKSLHSLPISQFSPTSGTLVVGVQRANGTPLEDIDVSITGPESRGPAESNELGCVIFQFLTPGAYDVEINEAGYVDQGLNQEVHLSGTVSSGQINQTTVLVYEPAAAMSAKYNGDDTTYATQFTLGNEDILMAAPKIRRYAPTNQPARGLFPFASAYRAYSGNCTSNDPLTYDANFYSDRPGVADRVLPAGGAETVNLREPPLRARVRAKYKIGSTTTNNGPYTAVGDTGRLYVKPHVTGCTLNPAIPTLVNDGTNLTSFELPYGTYRFCAEFNKTSGSGSNGVWSVSRTNVANTTYAGTSTADLIVDTTSSQGTNGKPCVGAGARSW